MTAIQTDSAAVGLNSLYHNNTCMTSVIHSLGHKQSNHEPDKKKQPDLNTKLSINTNQVHFILCLQANQKPTVLQFLSFS